jgi:hypothetical protein
MFGAITGAIGIIKKAGPIIGGVKKVVGAVTDSRSDIEQLYDSFKAKHDTDGDGASDWTPKESLEFASEVLMVVLQRI